MDELQKSRALGVASDLGCAFNWCDTDEGYDYWNNVFNALLAISDGNNPKPKENWVTPTDEYSRNRPNAEFRDNAEEDWEPGVLLSVDPTESNLKFSARTDYGDTYFQFCRMKKVSE